ncbi:hypothetical protein NM688_g9021 [Phlebia brevispora]|uniref:Uncharacterized protein n=1 Tax=Phlebia brevispora TaxID=194682 RepID=A0ACC1RKC6_9APHY|nr:hypothetical protein NM688_g9021 [Phlebia brevispora]
MYNENWTRSSTSLPLQEQATGTHSESERKSGGDDEKRTNIAVDTQVESRDSVTCVPPTSPVIPNGGLRAWIVVLASTMATFTTFGFVNAWGVYQTYYEQTLLRDQSPSTIAWIGSLQYALIFMTGIPCGRMFDKGWLRLPLGIASACLITATFLTAQCKEYWQFLLCQGFAIGLACGFVMAPMVNVVSQWFTTKKGLAYGCVGMGSSLGGVVFPIASRRLIAEVGFPWTMRIIGFVQICTLLITNLGTGRNLPPKKDLPPLSLRPFRESTAFTVYCASGLITFLGLYTVLTYIDLSARAAGLDENFSFYLVAIANAGSTVGRLGGGLLTDKIGPLNVMIPSTFIAGILTYIWPFSTSEGGYTIVGLIYGRRLRRFS